MTTMKTGKSAENEKLPSRPLFLETWQWGANKTPEGQFFSVAPESMREALAYMSEMEAKLKRSESRRAFAFLQAALADAELPGDFMPDSDPAERLGHFVEAYEAAESQLLAKDALIASLTDSLQSTLDRESATTARYDAKIEALEAEISKQNKAEDELLATGEKLAEEKA